MFLISLWIENSKTREERMEIYLFIRDILNKTRNAYLNMIKDDVLMYLDPKIDYRKISPSLRLCRTEKQKNQWKFLRLTISSLPYKHPPFRNLKFLLMDMNSDTILGFSQLISPTFSLKCRDKFIGWEKSHKLNKDRLSSVANMATCVPTQPFGKLCGGKLIAMLMSTKKIANIYKKKYKSDLVLLTTTSAYGKSIQYSGLKDWKFLGYTSGSGMLGSQLINIRALARKLDLSFSSSMNSIWVLHKICDHLNIPRGYLHHKLKKGFYVSPLFLNGFSYLCHEISREELISNNQETGVKVKLWKEKWYFKRLKKFNKFIENYSFNFANTKTIV